MNHRSSSIRAAIFPVQILELWVNGIHFFGGDFYGFKRAPILVHLLPGKNSIDVRLIRDVRANGGQKPPIIEASLQIVLVEQQVGIVDNSIIPPDVVDGKFVSSPASLTLTNFDDRDISVKLIKIEGEQNPQTTPCNIRISPGQSRPVQFVLSLPGGRDLYHGSVHYTIDGQQMEHCIRFEIRPVVRDQYEPVKLTFLHPSGTVSYAVLRPPSKSISEQYRGDLPILLALHGAGLDANSPQVRHSFDRIPDLPAWLLFPSGSSDWSSDDWHTWGLADVDAAVRAVARYARDNRWRKSGVIERPLVVCGHSNGGQGTWHLALAQPDRVHAAAVASGYTSIENYVPYVMWTATDSQQAFILQAARSSYKHELFVSNIANTPLLIQHGQLDDNVPPYHARLMKSLASQHRVQANYVELRDKGHWWDEAMVTAPMASFYDEHLVSFSHRREPFDSFECVVGNSHDFGACKGIVTDQIELPEVLGRYQVSRTAEMNRTIWRMRTTNIRHFHLDFSMSNLPMPYSVQIDDEPSLFEIGPVGVASFKASRDVGAWTRETSNSCVTLFERTGKQRGPDAILRSNGPFQIVYDSPHAFDVALQISRNLLQYYGASSDIRTVTEYGDALETGGNVFLVCLDKNPLSGVLNGFPLRVKDGRIQIRKRSSSHYRSLQQATSAMWLRPLPMEKVEMVVWGVDAQALGHASRMTPTLTGVGQPDFAVFSKKASWEGVAGTLALGFFDYSWNISSASYLP
jgi:predicted esterase